MADSNQYLTFTLGDEVYAVDVVNVREILELIPITRIPRTPDFMRGVINNRGSVVPVVDLRLKFGMKTSEQTVETCIIVTEVHLGGEAVIIGLLTDSVREVIQLDGDQVEPAPRLGTAIDGQFIKGIGKKEGAFILILEIDRLFSQDELSAVQGAAPAVEGSSR